MFPKYEDIVKKAPKSKYLTKAFYEDYCMDYQESCEDVSKYSRQVRKYYRTKQSDFYQKDSANYCQFLEVFDDMLPKFKVTYSAADNWEKELHSSIMSAPDIDTVAKLVKGIANANGWGVKIEEVR